MFTNEELATIDQIIARYPKSRSAIMPLLHFVQSIDGYVTCLLYTSPSPRDRTRSRMPSSA